MMDLGVHVPILKSPAGSRRWLAGAALVAASSMACSDGEQQRDGSWPAPIREPGVEPGLLGFGTTSHLDLSPWFGEDSKLVGIAVGSSGETHVLDQNTGLWRLLEDGSAELVLDAKDLDRRYGLSSDLTLTDVVAYGPDRFLITAENDGFLLDLWAGTFASYFCYFPATGEDIGAPVMSVSQALAAEGVPVTQRTESVAYNEQTGEIFAQPQTLRLDTAPSVVGSELFVFGASGGQPVAVMPLADLGFSAGGMVARANRLLLGTGDTLYELWADSTARAVSTLEPGVTVTGLALDRDGSLLILDGPSRRVLDVELFLRAGL
jgi:hypothetical protein